MSRRPNRKSKNELNDSNILSTTLTILLVGGILYLVYDLFKTPEKDESKKENYQRCY